MSSLSGKKILLGITGSIAAYKSAILARLFIKKGAEVKVIMTPASCDFISPLTLSTLSKNQVHVNIANGASWNSHVELGLWADLMVIAPTTATTLAKMTSGLADNMLIASYLSAKCPVFFAPAMDLDMWKHQSTKHNIATLQKYGDTLIPVGHGELASGLHGDGRIAEPEDIISFIEGDLNYNPLLKGKKVLITAGPTQEAIDPVRYIGNHSSGKMGIALAEYCDSIGAQVHLVLGPTWLRPKSTNIEVSPVQSAADMYKVMTHHYDQADIIFFAAAVADYTPTTPSLTKIKKRNKHENLDISLVRTKDIAGELGKRKKKDKLHIGFALETNNEEENALLKLNKKNFDMIVLNSMRDSGAGFGYDTNKVTVYKKDGTKKDFSLKSKNEVAKDIVNELSSFIK